MKTEKINLEGILQDLEDLTIDCTCTAGISKEDCTKCYRKMVAEYVLNKINETKKETANRFLSVVNSLLDDVEKGSITKLEELQLQLIYNVHFLGKEFGVKEDDNDKCKGSKNTFAKAK